MKKILLALFMALGCGLSMMAQGPVRYGYCPENVSPEDALAQGTGKNKFVAAMICLDPANDPVMQRLKGHQVKGVRCFLREDYKQARQKRSFVMACVGDPSVTPVKKMHDFLKGWNEVYFDEPLIIGEEKLYVGFQIFEKVGAAYPLLTDGAVSVPGSCWLNLDRKGWNELENRGTFMIQAILDNGAAVELENCAYAQISEHPLTLVPEEMFDAKVYFRNVSGKPIQSMVLNTIGDGDDSEYLQTVNFDKELAPYDARVLPLSLRAGKEVGAKQEISLRVSKVNDQEAQAARSGVSYLYLTLDAFLRIPLVEEFTSQLCPNCPFMMYYVEKAREAYEGPLLYITHHTGYQNDAFTIKGESDLLYLFGESGTYNPAIMYDRLYFPSESNIVLPSPGETSHLPYLEKFTEVAQRPAMAQVLVDVEKTANQVGGRVYGRINREMAASGEPLYLTAYLVEDGLSLEQYSQQGLDVEDAPEDLISGFRHNGIIRHVFTQSMKGDQLMVADDATFSVGLPSVDWKSNWNWENCQVVAFVHKMNEKDLTDNFVLNAGSNKLNHLITGIEQVEKSKESKVRIFVDGTRRVRTDVPVSSLKVYHLSGALCPIDTPLLSGVYIVQAVTVAGNEVVQKVLIK